jgi:hypothetical protein
MSKDSTASRLAFAIEEEHHCRKQYIQALRGKLLAQKGHTDQFKVKIARTYGRYWIEAKKTREKLEKELLSK